RHRRKPGGGPPVPDWGDHRRHARCRPRRRDAREGGAAARQDRVRDVQPRRDRPGHPQHGPRPEGGLAAPRPAVLSNVRVLRVSDPSSHVLHPWTVRMDRVSCKVRSLPKQPEEGGGRQ
ncbi:hypothetical protein HMPREF0058_0743, partial [Actinomyces urogenitalis DSM 15434]